ncbi:MAG: DNA mismatch repair endonuclease MutL [Deltaproteobacteria bacterium]|nr:DNA mismatch repair endonuclease MutL [Deltaproteobacteria bacterium]
MTRSRIQVLPDILVHQIAAGEVVERPVSVVRELVDNAIDAEATDIAVYLENGGRRKIRVVDNGIGMNKDEALLAFENHATSKVHSLEDLKAITTMGFRGEALPSIASISKVKLKTKREDEPAAIEIAIEGGKLKNVAEGSGQKGTDISVSNLFFNTPARRKFLRKIQTEEQKVKQWLLQTAVSHPAVRYRLFFDEREVLNLPRTETKLVRAQALLRGPSVSFDETHDQISVSGVIGHPGQATANTNSFVIVVNNRIVRDPLLYKAVKEGYDSTLKSYESPLGVLIVDLPATQLDVNVHPQKSEVRFANPQELFGAVRDSVYSAVQKFSFAVAAEIRRPDSFIQPSVSGYQRPIPLLSTQQQSGFDNHDLARFTERVVETETPLAAREGRSNSFESKFDSSHQVESQVFLFSELKYIGQAFKCYLFCEKSEVLYVVDMHAAHERYNYNLIRNGFRSNNINSQNLLVPITVELSEEGALNCLNNEDLFQRYGFEIESFGDATIVVRSTPTIMRESLVPRLIKEVAEISFDGLAQGRFEEVIDHISARIACHASVRSGKEMAKEEVYALFDALDSTEFSAACPHGRPVVVKFSEIEIESWFGRDK